MKGMTAHFCRNAEKGSSLAYKAGKVFDVMI